MEGDRTFVRERSGLFSALLPCSPTVAPLPRAPDEALRGAKDAASKEAMASRVQLSCDSEGVAYSLTVIPTRRPRVEEAREAAVIYAAAIGDLEGWREQERTNAALRSHGGRPVQYVSFAAINGGAMSAHAWFLWAPEQERVYQIMTVGEVDDAAGAAVLRSLLVPSP